MNIAGYTTAPSSPTTLELNCLMNGSIMDEEFLFFSSARNERNNDKELTTYAGERGRLSSRCTFTTRCIHPLPLKDKHHFFQLLLLPPSQHFLFHPQQPGIHGEQRHTLLHLQPPVQKGLWCIAVNYHIRG